MLVGVINPAAGHKPAVDLAHVLATSSPRLRLLMSDRADDVDGLVSAVREGAQLIVVAGGDGTTCNLLTRFAHAGLLESLPPLLVLPAGRVNTIASALVGSRRPAQLAQRILHAWTRGVRRIKRVPVLRVKVDGLPDHCGMTVSIGAVARIHSDYRHALMQGAPGILELAARLAMQRLPADRFAPIDGAVLLEPNPLRLHAVTFGILSPLPRYFHFVRPFPGVMTVSPGPGVHMTLANMGPLATQAVLPALLRGMLSSHPQLQSGTATRLSWTNGAKQDLVVLDGEELTVAPGAPVDVSVAGTVRMVVWRDMPAHDDSE
jgi:diacylglycerol kinase family enzyme